MKNTASIRQTITVVTSRKFAVGNDNSANAEMKSCCNQFKETIEMVKPLKITWCLIASFVVAAGLTVASGQPKEEGKSGESDGKPPLPLCPVMDEPVDFFVSAPTDSGPIYFCCKPCITKYQKNPDQYAGKIAAQRLALTKLPRIQVTCPMSGKPVRDDVVVEDKGQKIHFCCPNCADEFKASPAKHQGKVAASYTYQTQCPVDGDRIDPAVFAKTKSDNGIYFHRATCKEAFLKDPQPYLPKLAAQGIGVEAADFVEK